METKPTALTAIPMKGTTYIRLPVAGIAEPVERKTIPAVAHHERPHPMNRNNSTLCVPCNSRKRDKVLVHFEASQNG